MIKDQSWAATLFLFQLVAHGLLFYLVFNQPELLGWSILVYFLTGCFGMTMTYHRGLSHGSWRMPVWFEILGSILGTYGLTGSTIGWVAQHRKHHRHTDKPEDPHSPQHKGILRVQFLSMFDPVNVKFASHLIRSKLHTTLHKYYFLFHICAILVLYILGGVVAVATFWGAPAAILWQAGSLVNTLNHMLGYRNTETKDHSKNNFITGYLVFGEGWHNNHHSQPNKCNFKQQWWEFDIAHQFIRLLSK